MCSVSCLKTGAAYSLSTNRSVNREVVLDLFSLAGRKALISGGSRGLGKWIAEAFVEQGASVFITSRNAAACEAAAAEIGRDATALPGDVSTAEGCRRLADQLAGLTDRLDVLVNNAGAAWGAKFEDFPEQGWDKVMNVSLKGPFFLTQALYPLLKAAAGSRPAKVLNIASVDGLRINQWETYSYHAAKAGLVHLTRRMAARLIADNIIVSGIAPGAFPSDMNRAARDAPEAVGQAIPAGRVGGRDDIAGAAIYLASRAGDYVVGETIVVDGGLVHAECGKSIDA